MTPGTIRAARLSQGLMLAALARRADLTVDAVTAAEEGDAVATEMADALGAALGIPPDAPEWAVHHAQDPMHGRMLDVMAALVIDRPGWLVAPDVAAWEADAGHVEGDGPRLLQAHRSLHLRIAAGLVGADALACSATAWAGLPAIACVDVGLVGLLAVLVQLTVVRGTPASVRRHDRERDRRAELRSTAFHVSEGGLAVMTVRDGRTTVAEHPVGTIVSIDVAQEAGGHVTVTVRTIHGDVVMPWLPWHRRAMETIGEWAGTADAVPVSRGVRTSKC